ncbi:MAG: CopG family transcriptional regulator, nickel-responsive regulator [Shewanella sp.]|jgi:CopG family nickel-responsive transcriptional regulator|uniref:nickel-responsive transcriptional regulator NikR n=1 Tax=Shewanella TaxID=22 RepID=UPI001679DAB1|nr:MULTISPECIES: nickel-responsive transcriptional regulator NikR [Shewanella]MBO1271154.1 nickel-responsive transcriptional regulator NikR [Shewanella sp. 4t3-1-2LB]MCL2905491.1 nickel-responsive transcriptional regulator NikR [Shewanella fodinae]MDN5370262.1 CopG family transcriptional regulator, nickel-responsive regulator [Shewanella sp.]GGY91476.1 putative nickel-responsive regulator [Shewanella fodinae]
MSNDETLRFTVSLPQSLFEEIEADIEARGYQSRSEYIRDLFRDRIVDKQWNNSLEDVVGVLTVIFDHHQRGLSEKLIEIQHDHLVHILCSTHVHIDHHRCLETIILKGQASQVNQLVNKIAALKGVNLARLSRAGIV